MWAACPSRIDEQEQAEERRERESGVISKSFLFSYFKLYLYLFIFYIIYNSFSNQTICLSHLLPLNNSRSQLYTFLEILSFFQLKIVIIWYESPACADMVAIQSSGSIVADMITALTHTIVKHRKMEPLNVDVWKMRMQLLLKEQDLFFSFLRKEKPADLALMASSIKLMLL